MGCRAPVVSGKAGCGLSFCFVVSSSAERADAGGFLQGSAGALGLCGVGIWAEGKSQESRVNNSRTREPQGRLQWHEGRSSHGSMGHWEPAKAALEAREEEG